MSGQRGTVPPSLGDRYWGFTTDKDSDPKELDRTVRAEAHVGRHSCCPKDSSLTRFLWPHEL